MSARSSIIWRRHIEVASGFAFERAPTIEERMTLSPYRLHPRIKSEGMLWRIKRYSGASMMDREALQYGFARFRGR